jgi:sulfite reductase (NADPH) flavoprotein alpha-component
MSVEAGTALAATVLADAESRNATLGHENFGSLSHSHGFVTVVPPRHDLPPPHSAWIEAADELPELCRSLRVRRRLEELPLLDASPASLDDRDLLRAASVVGLLTQAYNNVPMRAPEALPEQLTRPWLQIAERLVRPALTLSTTDYIWHNWRFIDSESPDPLRVENLRLLTDIWDHPQMETFMLVVLEMMAQSAPVVGAVARAQQAAMQEDDDALKAELALMAETVHRLTFESLPKANANARSGRRRVDPVVWTKLFAMLPLPVKGAEGVRNASGVETPFFHLMDVFLGRTSYDTQLGHEALLFRQAYPAHWREFLAAVARAPVAPYVTESGDAELKGLFQELAESYYGRHGLLGRHRLKAFCYMDAAFKAGRSATVTGFSGMFEDRAWEKVDASFEAARVERERSSPALRRLARVELVEDLCPNVRRIVFDVRGLGMHCRPGDRCAVLPENDSDLVARTLQALHAKGDELLDLTPAWREALPLRPGRSEASEAPLRDVLAFGHIRPVPRETAKAFYALTNDQSLYDILEARTEDQWELWDLLQLLAEHGFAPQRLWRARRGDYENLCRLVPPMEPRLYSVSAIDAPGGTPERIELTVGHLAYESVESPTTVVRRREGMGSTYLFRTLAERPDAEVSIQVVRPAAFALPADPSVPIVMFAGGTGIAPFRGFLHARTAVPGTENIIYVGARSAEAVPYHEELDAYAARGEAEVRFAFSRDPSGERRHVDDLVRNDASRLRGLLGAGACMYVCGRAQFSRTVMDALAEVLGGCEAVFDLVAQDRYMQDVFTTYTGSTALERPHVDVSDLVHRTTVQGGTWQAIDGRVYDLTEFAQIHPGGHRLIESFSGMDATGTYRLVEHHRDPQVEAMLSMYEVGLMRRLAFGARWSIAVGERGLEHVPLEELFRRWVRCLYVLVEIENAHRMETSIRDEPLNRHEYDGSRPSTEYRLQFGLEAHSRFLGQTLPVVCRRFATLWQTTCGPCDARESARSLGEELEAILAGDDARAAREHREALELALAAEGATDELDRRLVELRASDAGYLIAAKSLVASGVAVFEEHEEHVLDAAAPQLLDALRGIVPLTVGHLEEAAAGGR